nr:eugenol synthase 1 [Quercus suber]
MRGACDFAQRLGQHDREILYLIALVSGHMYSTVLYCPSTPLPMQLLSIGDPLVPDRSSAITALHSHAIKLSIAGPISVLPSGSARTHRGFTRPLNQHSRLSGRTTASRNIFVVTFEHVDHVFGRMVNRRVQISDDLGAARPCSLNTRSGGSCDKSPCLYTECQPPDGVGHGPKRTNAVVMAGCRVELLTKLWVERSKNPSRYNLTSLCAAQLYTLKLNTISKDTMAIKNVAIAGVNGRIGRFIIQALLDSNRFTVTALIRKGSTTTTNLPGLVNIAAVDYADHNSLVNALEGQDAVISAMKAEETGSQNALLEAAIAARVQRFIPSEFGSDVRNEKARNLPVFEPKRNMEQRLEKFAAEGKISYTYVYSGPWLDLGLEVGFLGLDLQKKQLTFTDGGITPFSTTTRETVAKAVTEVLMNAEATSNQAVYVEDVALTLRDLLRLAKQVLGEEGWTETDMGTTETIEKATYEKLAQGEGGMSVFLGFLTIAIFGQGYGGHFQKLDNDLLDISTKKEHDIVELIRQIVKAQTN